MDETPAADWAERADLAQAALTHCYLGPIGYPGLAVVGSPPTLKDRFANQYWLQAQLLDLLIDREQRRPSRDNRARISRLPVGQRIANRGTLIRDYYDDMGWMALALLRAGRVGDAERLWQRIVGGWNDRHGGGIMWRVQQPSYKNVCANGPAAILASRLGHREWAERITDWMGSVLIDRGSGRVLDGVDQRGDGALDDRQFSYNYGLALAAELELGRREVAERIALAGIERCTNGAVMRAEGDGDGAMFHGIFARYLALLDSGPARAVVLATAAAHWRGRDGQGRFGPDPRQGTTAPVQLSAMLSGVMTIEAAARLTSS